MSKMKDKAIDMENENAALRAQIEALTAVGDRMAEVLIGEGYDELINAWRAVEDLT